MDDERQDLNITLVIGFVSENCFVRTVHFAKVEFVAVVEVMQHHRQGLVGEDDTAASSKSLLLPVMKLFHSQVSMLWTTPEQRSLYHHLLRRH